MQTQQPFLNLMKPASQMSPDAILVAKLAQEHLAPVDDWSESEIDQIQAALDVEFPCGIFHLKETAQKLGFECNEKRARLIQGHIVRRRARAAARARNEREATVNVIQATAPIYLAVVREVPGFRFYLNACGETTKYPANAAKFDSIDAAKTAISEAKMENPASGVALFNSSYQPSSGEPMVWETQ